MALEEEKWAKKQWVLELQRDFEQKNVRLQAPSSEGPTSSVALLKIIVFGAWGNIMRHTIFFSLYKHNIAVMVRMKLWCRHNTRQSWDLAGKSLYESLFLFQEQAMLWGDRTDSDHMIRNTRNSFVFPKALNDVTIPEQAWCSMLGIQCCSLFFLPTFYLNIVNVRAFVFRVPLILNGWTISSWIYPGFSFPVVI